MTIAKFIAVQKIPPDKAQILSQKAEEAAVKVYGSGPWAPAPNANLPELIKTDQRRLTRKANRINIFAEEKLRIKWSDRKVDVVVAIADVVIAAVSILLPLMGVVDISQTGVFIGEVTTWSAVLTLSVKIGEDYHEKKNEIDASKARTEFIRGMFEDAIKDLGSSKDEAELEEATNKIDGNLAPWCKEVLPDEDVYCDQD